MSAARTKTVPNVPALLAVVISIAAFALALLGGGLMAALSTVFAIVGLGGDAGVINYPLGAGVFAVYALGLALGFAAMRWPARAGLAMFPLALCAFLFGGPVAKLFAVGIACAGTMLLVMTRHRNRKHTSA